MNATSHILFAGDRAWRVGTLAASGISFSEITTADDAAPADIAAQVAAALRELGYRGEPTILALPSAWCLVAPISGDGLPKGDRKAMLFRLEEKLPLAAEQVVADFVPHPRRPLGVCARIERARPLVEALEAKQIAVQSVTPAALLAAQGMVGADQRAQVLLLGEADQVNVVAVSEGRPLAWLLLPAAAPDLKLQLDMLALEVGAMPPARACAVDLGLLRAVAQQGVAMTVRDDTPAAAATRLAPGLLSGKLRPWIELRRDELAIRDGLRLYRKAINAALAAAAAFLILLAGAMFLRAQAYQRRTAVHERELANEFRQAFPGWTVPPNVRATVESERRKALARMPAALPAEMSGSSLQVLQRVLGNVPQTLRLKVDRMMFSDNSFDLEGHLLAYEDVDALTAAVRKAGMQVAPPQVRKDADGFWSFAMHGDRR